MNIQGTPSKAQLRANLMAESLEQKRGKLGPDCPLPEKEITQQAFVECLNSRTGKLLAKAPKLAKAPLGHILHKLIHWHGSGGNLWGIALLDIHAANAVEKLNLKITGRELYNQLDTLALVARGGKSSASEAWRQALGQ